MHEKTHTIIDVAVKGRTRTKLPVILLPDGSRFFEALHWTCERYQQGLSPSSLTKQNQAIGAFIDFYMMKGCQPVALNKVQALLAEFRTLRTDGCIQPFWKPISIGSAEREVMYISTFFDHCAATFGYFPINAHEDTPTNELSQTERRRHYTRTSASRNGVLGYLFKFSKTGRGLSSARPVRGRQRLPRDSGCYKSFPPLFVSKLIESCHSVRDVLVFLLLFYGGVRSSEACHILLSDVSPFPDPVTGQAVVTLAHPAYGLIDYRRKSDGILVQSCQRQIYLQNEFGLIPRHQLPTTDGLHAGWKGMAYEDKGYRAVVHWVRPDIGILFYQLHKQYMTIRARMGTTHPYYFVNTNAEHSGEHFGEPMKLKGLRDRFYDAAKRIGLLPGKGNGVNPHGARHFYAYFLANVLKVSKEMAMRFLHHSDISSTDIYYNITAAVARDALSAAFERSQNDPLNPLTQPLNLQKAAHG